MTSGRRLRTAGVALLICLLAAGLPLRAAEVIDRVLAVVSGTVILASDVRIADAFGAVDTARAPDPTLVTLRWLIDRQLVLDEVSRYDTAEPAAARTDAALARVRARFADARAWAGALERLGLEPAAARRWVEDTLRMQDYLSRRFDTAFPPTDEELQDYFTHNASRFVRNGVALSFEEAREDVRGILQADRQRQAVETWLTRLRRRANISELYVPAR